MAKIEIAPDCGNAPRKVFLAKFYTALANGDAAFLNEHIPQDIVLNIAGRETVTGSVDVASELMEAPHWKPRRVTIDTIITHGREAAVSGEITTPDKTTYLFCDICKFKGASGTSIKELVRFLVPKQV